MKIWNSGLRGWDEVSLWDRRGSSCVRAAEHWVSELATPLARLWLSYGFSQLDNRGRAKKAGTCSTSVHLLQMIIWALCCNPNLQIREQELGKKICWVPHERDRYATFFDNPMLIYEVLNMLQKLLRLFVKSHPFLPLETVAIDDDYANLSSPPPLNKLQSVADNYGWCRL